MIRQIFRKEVLENLLSLRFILSLLLIISLFAASGFVFVSRYRKQSQDYWKKTNENLSVLREESGQLYRLAFYQQKVFRKPKPLTFCVEGFEKSLPNCFRFDAFASDLPEIQGQGNFILPHFSDIDWVFVTSMILSFVALVFTYDSICGERERGTLRLMLAGTIPRYTVLLGKYFAAMFTLGIPLLIGLLVSLVIVVSSKDIAIPPGEWLKILTIVLLSFLYLSIFVLLGVFVSSRTAHSANSMVILLLVWVGLGILVPSFGRIVSDLSSKSVTQIELRRKLDEALKHISSDKYGKNAGSMSTNLNDPINNPPAHAKFITAKTNTRNQVMDDHHNRMVAQVSAGWNLARISPTVIYQRASEAVAGTGISHCVNLYQQIKPYQDNLKQYIRDEDVKDPNSLHLIFPEESCARSWRTISHNPVDFDNVPKFQERDLELSQSLKLAIWDIGLLALFNLVFFAASFVSFLRYDVR
jgi:ABC-type transport system involved in multi-copper enzyme maturation permease subunit